MTATPKSGPLAPEAEGRGRGVGLAWALALFGPFAVWTLATVAASAAVPDEVAAGQCEGIGFGCTLSPADGVLFAGVYVGLFVVPIATVILLAVAGFTRRQTLAVVGAVLAVFASAVVVLAALIAARPPNT